ncbi:MAG TPA: hydroxymethylbilane synthase [Ignavibacteriales bacterium]|nr:hydroxymethylbilane synthase [Ignavibacteriales bacterium]
MKEKRKIIIGSRGSELALWQANHIKSELEKKNKSVKVEIKIVKTTGDKILDVALSKIGDKGLFTKELERELLNHSVDLAVHSLKDLQTDIPQGLKLSAVTKRHNVEDALIARKKGMGIKDLKEGAVVATGSLRRRAQLLHMRPDLKIVELRGNVPGRIEKFLKSEWDAIILARAGVERLNLKKHISSFIPVEQMLPAVGQGALGIEIHEDNEFVHEVLQSLNNDDVLGAVRAERAFLKTLEGGCQAPIGALAVTKTNGIYIDGLVAAIDGSVTYRKKARGKKSDPEGLGKALAKDLIKAGAGETLNEIFKQVRK